MIRVVNWLRLSLFTFSGEDDYIIRRCNKRIQLAFAGIGLSVLIIFMGCWVSASSFTAQLFEGSSKLMSLPIGILWALLVANMYLLLLYTISPTLLPVSKKRNQTKSKQSEEGATGRKSPFTASLIFRVSFISLLAVIIAQPLNVLLLSSFAERSLSAYKIEYRVNVIIGADSLLINNEVQSQAKFYKRFKSKYLNDSIAAQQNINLLNEKVLNDQTFLARSTKLLDSLKQLNKLSFSKNHEKCDSLGALLTELLDNELKSDSEFVASIDDMQYDDKLLQADFDKYKEELKTAISSKIRNYNRLDGSLSKSNFYVKNIQILLNENPIAWVLTISICLIFLGPIYLKFSIRNLSGFYEEKGRIEHRMVLDAYNNFKTEFSKILELKTSDYNHKSWQSIMQQIAGLKKVDADKYHELSVEIKKDLQEEPIIKYEYWADPPFRTKRKSATKHFSSETDLLRHIYPDSL